MYGESDTMNELEILEAEFQEEMIDIFHAASKRTHGAYRPRRLLEMIGRHGGVKAAKQLLNTKEFQSGFTILWEHSCLDISVEALVLKDQFRELFDEAELREAQWRLLAHRYDDFTPLDEP